MATTIPTFWEIFRELFLPLKVWKWVIICYLAFAFHTLLWDQTQLYRLRNAPKNTIETDMSYSLRHLVKQCTQYEEECPIIIRLFITTLKYKRNLNSLPRTFWGNTLNLQMEELRQCKNASCVEDFSKNNSVLLSIAYDNANDSFFSDDTEDFQQRCKDYWVPMSFGSSP